MILFMILLLMVVLLTVLTIAAVSVIGATGIVLFGDVIVCVFIIIWIMKRLFGKKKR